MSNKDLTGPASCETRRQVKIVRPSKLIAKASPADAGCNRDELSVEDGVVAESADLFFSSGTAEVTPSRCSLKDPNDDVIAHASSDEIQYLENSTVGCRGGICEPCVENVDCSKSEESNGNGKLSHASAAVIRSKPIVENQYAHRCAESSDHHKVCFDDALRDFLLKNLQLIEKEQKQNFGSSHDTLSMEQFDSLMVADEHEVKKTKKHKKSHRNKCKKRELKLAVCHTLAQARDYVSKRSKKHKKRSHRQSSKQKSLKSVSSGAVSEAKVASCKYSDVSESSKLLTDETMIQKSISHSEKLHVLFQYNSCFPCYKGSSGIARKLSVWDRLQWSSVPDNHKSFGRSAGLVNERYDRHLDSVHFSAADFHDLQHKGRDAREDTDDKPHRQHHCESEQRSKPFSKLKYDENHLRAKTVSRTNGTKRSLQCDACDDGLAVLQKKCRGSKPTGRKNSSQKHRYKASKEELMQNLFNCETSNYKHGQKSKNIMPKKTKESSNSSFERDMCETGQGICASVMFSTSSSSADTSIIKTNGSLVEAPCFQKPISETAAHNDLLNDEKFLPMKACKDDDKEDVISKIILGKASKALNGELPTSRVFIGKRNMSHSIKYQSKMVVGHSIHSEIFGECTITDYTENRNAEKRKGSDCSQLVSCSGGSQPAVSDGAAGGVSRKYGVRSNSCAVGSGHTGRVLASTDHDMGITVSTQELPSQRGDACAAEVQTNSLGTGEKALSTCFNVLSNQVENENVIDDAGVSIFKIPKVLPKKKLSVLKLGLKIADSTAAIISRGESINSSNSSGQQRTLEEGELSGSDKDGLHASKTAEILQCTTQIAKSAYDLDTSGRLTDYGDNAVKWKSMCRTSPCAKSKKSKTWRRKYHEEESGRQNHNKRRLLLTKRHTLRSPSRSRSRSFSVTRTFDSKRGVWRVRKQREIRARQLAAQKLKLVSDLRLKIDKQRLREIAVKNAYENMKAGTGPAVKLRATELCKITKGGNTVEELTDLCKSLMRANSYDSDSHSSEDDVAGRHLQLRTFEDEENKLLKSSQQSGAKKRRIILNIRNARQLPIFTRNEKLAQAAAALRLNFPVSSGTFHRSRESEWQPVVPKIRTAAQNVATSKDGQEANNPEKHPATTAVNIKNIGQIVSERLNAMRQLSANPYNIVAQNAAYKAEQQLQQWALSKKGCIPAGARPPTKPRPLFKTVYSRPPVLKGNAIVASSVGTIQLPTDQKTVSVMSVGKFLLQKMGWKEGEGLGKNNEGPKAPLELVMKMDRRGLDWTEQHMHRQPSHPTAVGSSLGVPISFPDLAKLHPVPALLELTIRKRWMQPAYELIEESGPSHLKSFRYKVIVDGVEYEPACSSRNKKTARAEAAMACIQQLAKLPIFRASRPSVSQSTQLIASRVNVSMACPQPVLGAPRPSSSRLMDHVRQSTPLISSEANVNAAGSKSIVTAPRPSIPRSIQACPQRVVVSAPIRSFPLGCYLRLPSSCSQLQPPSEAYPFARPPRILRAPLAQLSLRSGLEIHDNRPGFFDPPPDFTKDPVDFMGDMQDFFFDRDFPVIEQEVIEDPIGVEQTSLVGNDLPVEQPNPHRLRGHSGNSSDPPEIVEKVCDSFASPFVSTFPQSEFNTGDAGSALSSCDGQSRLHTSLFGQQVGESPEREQFLLGAGPRLTLGIDGGFRLPLTNFLRLPGRRGVRGSVRPRPFVMSGVVRHRSAPPSAAR